MLQKNPFPSRLFTYKPIWLSKPWRMYLCRSVTLLCLPSMLCFHCVFSFLTTQKSRIHNFPFRAFLHIICTRLACPTAKPRRQGWQGKMTLLCAVENSPSERASQLWWDWEQTLGGHLCESNAPAERAPAVLPARWREEMAASEPRLQGLL